MVTRAGVIRPFAHRSRGTVTVAGRGFGDFGAVWLDDEASAAFEQGIITIGQLFKGNAVSQEVTSKLLGLLMTAYVERILSESVESSIRIGMDSLMAEAVDD